MGMRIRPRVVRLLVAMIVATVGIGPADAASPAIPDGWADVQAATSAAQPAASIVRIAYLHHSTGENVWNGGVPGFISAWDKAHAKRYRITELTYPSTAGGYSWENYPYDYWNLWVRHRGSNRDRGELTLDQLAATYKVIVFKHCFPVSDILPDSASKASVSSSVKTIANYKLQYLALRKRMHQFPHTKFILWTGPALTAQTTTVANAKRAVAFANWVRRTWDVKGDNIFIWDFRTLETKGGLYLLPAYASPSNDPHPNASFSKKVAPLIGRRIVDVIEGRGDRRSITGQ
jgi:hypothetical protein